MDFGNEKYLIFKIDEEYYGIEILKIKEIIGIMPITRLPGEKGEIEGIINLRGQIIPVIDLRKKFGFPEREYDDRTCIIILEYFYNKEKILYGVIVDRVIEVMKISSQSIEKEIKLGKEIDTMLIGGIATVNKMVITILNVENIITGKELKEIKEGGKGDE